MEYRIERDSMGEMKVQADRYWAAQTQRSIENFKISGEVMPREITYACGLLKKAAAIANNRLGKLSDEKLNYVKKVCDEITSASPASKNTVCPKVSFKTALQSFILL